ncbi:maleylpyruvate isomerase family mycothiol-dependent enzyme [Catenuloplanes japonicus]|uniref:maleylpyruvate isomerase family mycothiol-dependent enzyme n=1 Tax=Catenuloplanes japonicus TaxID=33876 RepID=UPI0005270D35|nr:maleylpyruvate isomerase family mycothiol-dependent enzyme [Catenuloplanes japonicus]
MEFTELLRLIDDRSEAFRRAVASAPDLDVQVPSCPEWTLFDLAQHIGAGRRSWAATVLAGPDATAKSPETETAPREREALQVWLADSTQQLVDALRDAGPDRGCWSWWAGSQSPLTCHAVARHQLQQYAVHAYDAQLTVGTPEPLPAGIALDGVEEFLHTCCTTTSPWPHAPATVDYHAAEGRSWRQELSPTGSRVYRLDPAAAPGTMSVRASASDLVFLLYGRISPGDLEITGDRGVLDRLDAWDFSA